jgi:hypothetical protein
VPAVAGGVMVRAACAMKKKSSLARLDLLAENQKTSGRGEQAPDASSKAQRFSRPFHSAISVNPSTYVFVFH